MFVTLCNKFTLISVHYMEHFIEMIIQSWYKIDNTKFLYITQVVGLEANTDVFLKTIYFIRSPSSRSESLRGDSSPILGLLLLQWKSYNVNNELYQVLCNPSPVTCSRAAKQLTLI